MIILLNWCKVWPTVMIIILNWCKVWQTVMIIILNWYKVWQTVMIIILNWCKVWQTVMIIILNWCKVWQGTQHKSCHRFRSHDNIFNATPDSNFQTTSAKLSFEKTRKEEKLLLTLHINQNLEIEYFTMSTDWIWQRSNIHTDRHTNTHTKSHTHIDMYTHGSGLASVFRPRLIIFQKDWNNLSSISPLTDHFSKFSNIASFGDWHF